MAAGKALRFARCIALFPRQEHSGSANVFTAAEPGRGQSWREFPAWLVNNYIPMQSSIKSILNAVVVIAVVLWLLNVFGLFTSLSRLHVGR